MDSHVIDFYTPYAENPTNGHFHDVIPLGKSSTLSWDDVHEKIPSMCKGWYELSQLTTKDRIEFTHDFWLSRLPFHCDLTSFLQNFFSNLDDIAVFVVQRKFEDPYEAHFVYSIGDDGGFFYGKPPASAEEIDRLQDQFSSTLLPPDYLAFLQIHNGFAKSTDTGIHPSAALREEYDQFQNFLNEVETVVTTKGDPVDATTLIPFYKSFDRPYYQCFLGDWYPDQEMGNVYFSGVTHTISDYKSKDPMNESLAFHSFLDWLMFYLEKID